MNLWATQVVSKYKRSRATACNYSHVANQLKTFGDAPMTDGKTAIHPAQAHGLTSGSVATLMTAWNRQAILESELLLVWWFTLLKFKPVIHRELVKYTYTRIVSITSQSMNVSSVTLFTRFSAVAALYTKSGNN